MILIIGIIVVIFIVMVLAGIKETTEYEEKYMSSSFTHEIVNIINQNLNRKDCFLKSVTINKEYISLYMYPYDVDGYVIEKISRWENEDMYVYTMERKTYKEMGYENIETHFSSFANAVNKCIPNEFNITINYRYDNAHFIRSKSVPSRPKQELKSVL